MAHINVPLQLQTNGQSWMISEFSDFPKTPAVLAWDRMTDAQRQEALVKRSWTLTYGTPPKAHSALVSLDTRSTSPTGKAGTLAVYVVKDFGSFVVQWFDNVTGEIIA